MSQGIIKHEVAHHFQDAEQEFNAVKIGMWAFIAQEILFFSALFVAYGVFRYLHPEMYAYASSHLSLKLGLLNTIVLITSSLTMVLAVRDFQLDRKNAGIRNLILTFGLAGMFLVVKYFEYSAKIHHGFLPARWFFAEAPFDTLHLFFGLYFVMTGLHAIHIIVGMGLIAWLIKRATRGEFHHDYFTPVEMVGLYWHLVDIVWIFIFPLLYLI